MKIELTEKQYEAIGVLTDPSNNHIREIMFGGAMGGGKTWLGCVWLIYMCDTYPNTRWLMGRSRLKDIKDSTLIEFQEILSLWGLDDVEVHFNNLRHEIVFPNGSVIEMKALAFMPSDPEVNRIKAAYTGGFIDEASDCDERVYKRILSRLRWRTGESGIGISGKLLIASNPAQGFLKRRFWDLYKDGELTDDRSYIPSNMGDNKHLDQGYVDGLTVDAIGAKEYNYQVLGDWDFEDGDDNLFFSDMIDSAFMLDSKNEDNTMYITCDPAGGRDKDSTVIVLWEGYRVKRIWKNNNWKLFQTEQFIKDKMRELSIPPYHLSFDANGVGLDISQRFRGCKQYFTSSRPFNGEPYKNLKAQLWYKFSKAVNSGDVVFMDDSYQDEIKEELLAHKKSSFGDQKMDVTKKDIVKASIGRSPDIGDALVLREIFEFSKTGFLIERLK